MVSKKSDRKGTCVCGKQKRATRGQEANVWGAHAAVTEAAGKPSWTAEGKTLPANIARVGVSVLFGLVLRRSFDLKQKKMKKRGIRI